MADNTEEVKKTKMEEYEDIAKQSYDMPTILSGAKNIIKEANFGEGVVDETKNNREEIRRQSVEGFNPIIDKNWTYPGYKEDKENVLDKKSVYKESEKDLKQQVKDIEDDYKERKKEAKEDIKNRKKSNLEAILERSSERQTEEAKNKQGKKVEDYKAKEQDYLKKSNKAKTRTGANIYLDLARMQKDLAKKEAQKEAPIKKANLLNLSKEEREAVLNNDKSLAKEKLETVKNLNDEMANSIDVLKGSEEYKAAEKVVEDNKEAYQKAKKELNKKQTPYAIRNAFLIIDAIYKTFRNIGRAMPQVQNSPAYTRTPEEVPELFKHWANQIGKSMEREQKTEETLADIINSNTQERYQTPKGLAKDVIERNMSWADKAKAMKLSQKEKLIAEETEKALADMANEYTDKDIANFAKAANLYQMRKGDKDYTGYEYTDYIINNFNSIDRIKRFLRFGGVAKDMVKGALEGIKDSLFFKASTLGIGSAVLGGIVGSLDALPDLKTDEEFMSWAEDVHKVGVDINLLLKAIQDMMNKQKDKNLQNKIDSKRKAYQSALNDYKKDLDDFNARYPDYQPPTGGPLSTSTTTSGMSNSAWNNVQKKKEKAEKLEADLNKLIPESDAINELVEQLTKKNTENNNTGSNAGGK